MGIGIGGENWLTLAMRWFYGVETEPAEMPVLYRQDDVDDIRSELIDKIDRLMMDRKSLFTVAEVNKHAEYASAAIRQTVDSFRKENETPPPLRRWLTGLCPTRSFPRFRPKSRFQKFF